MTQTATVRRDKRRIPSEDLCAVDSKALDDATLSMRLRGPEIPVDTTATMCARIKSARKSLALKGQTRPNRVAA